MSKASRATAAYKRKKRKERESFEGVLDAMLKDSGLVLSPAQLDYVKHFSARRMRAAPRAATLIERSAVTPIFVVSVVGAYRP